jgi:hypothetical protein
MCCLSFLLLDICVTYVKCETQSGVQFRLLLVKHRWAMKFSDGYVFLGYLRQMYVMVCNASNLCHQNRLHLNL